MAKKDLRPMKDAADLAGCNRNTLRRWVGAGTLPATPGIIAGRLVKLVDMADVRRLIGPGPLKPGPKAKKRKVSP